MVWQFHFQPCLPYRPTSSQAGGTGDGERCRKGAALSPEDPKQLFMHSRVFLAARALQPACPASCLGIQAVRLATQLTWTQLANAAGSGGSHSEFPTEPGTFDGLQRSVLNKNKCL